jgi:hypothetical protein
LEGNALIAVSIVKTILAMPPAEEGKPSSAGGISYAENYYFFGLLQQLHSGMRGMQYAHAAPRCPAAEAGV